MPAGEMRPCASVVGLLTQPASRPAFDSDASPSPVASDIASKTDHRRRCFWVCPSATASVTLASTRASAGFVGIPRRVAARRTGGSALPFVDPSGLAPAALPLDHRPYRSKRRSAGHPSPRFRLVLESVSLPPPPAAPPFRRVDGGVGPRTARTSCRDRSRLPRRRRRLPGFQQRSLRPYGKVIGMPHRRSPPGHSSVGITPFSKGPMLSSPGSGERASYGALHTSLEIDRRPSQARAVTIGHDVDDRTLVTNPAQPGVTLCHDPPLESQQYRGIQPALRPRATTT